MSCHARHSRLNKTRAEAAQQRAQQRSPAADRSAPPDEIDLEGAEVARLDQVGGIGQLLRRDLRHTAEPSMTMMICDDSAGQTFWNAGGSTTWRSTCQLGHAPG